MKIRNLTILLLVASTAALAAGCGGSDSASGSGGHSTMELKSSPSKATSSDGSATTTPDSSDSSGSGDSSDSGSGGSSDTSLPDLGDLGVTSDCLAAATAFGQMAGLAMTGNADDATKAQEQIDALKAKLPSDLQGDLQTLADAYKTLATEGLIKGGQEFESAKVQKASQDVNDYFTANCGSSTTTP